MLAVAGHRVAGADQSAGMLAQARARGIAFSLERTALQYLSYAREFDAVITVDAMENIPPEDWPRVLANFVPGCTAGWPDVSDGRGAGPGRDRAGLREPFRSRAAPCVPAGAVRPGLIKPVRLPGHVDGGRCIRQTRQGDLEMKAKTRPCSYCQNSE
jgi:hypothetical protein